MLEYHNKYQESHKEKKKNLTNFNTLIVCFSEKTCPKIFDLANNIYL